MPRKKTTEEFIAKAKEVHGDRYDYSPTRYVNSRTKVDIRCFEHGVFKQRPGDHLSGKGCPECGGSRKLSTEEFIARAKEVHGDRYGYSPTRYMGSKTKVSILCPEHGVFKQTPNDHLKGHGCPKCGKEQEANARRSSTEEFIAKAKEVHGDRYGYTLTCYTDSATKVDIYCFEHGVFQQTPNDHLSGRGCPRCSSGWAERYKNAPVALLYYLRVEPPEGEILYKIGITLKSVEQRWKGERGAVLTLLMAWEYRPGGSALSAEIAIKAQHAPSAYKGAPILNRYGNTELFVRDVLELDTPGFARAFPPRVLRAA